MGLRGMLTETEDIRGAVALQKTCALTMVMKEMGNGVVRLMSADLVPLDTQLLPVLSAGAILADPLPWHLDDLAAVALSGMGDAAAGWSVQAPAHGFARFLDDGLTEVLLRLAMVA